jgi:hypothetical protein
MLACLDIVEEDDMPVRHRHSWRLRRRPSPRPDGQQRWDRAYLHLLQWAERPAPTQPAPGQEQGEEDSHDGCVVCPCFEPAPDQRPNH